MPENTKHKTAVVINLKQEKLRRENRELAKKIAASHNRSLLLQKYGVVV